MTTIHDLRVKTMSLEQMADTIASARGLAKGSNKFAAVSETALTYLKVAKEQGYRQAKDEEELMLHLHGG